MALTGEKQFPKAVYVRGSNNLLSSNYQIFMILFQFWI